MKDKIINICNVTSGDVYDISNSTDKTFASKALGNGFVVFPKVDEQKGLIKYLKNIFLDSNKIIDIYSPVDGEIYLIMDSKHAFVVRSEEEIDILVHVGIDTVKLNGQGFKTFVTKGEKVKKGQKILEVDLSLIESKGLSCETLVIITKIFNDDVKIVKTGFCNINDVVLDIHL